MINYAGHFELMSPFRWAVYIPISVGINIKAFL